MLLVSYSREDLPIPKCDSFLLRRSPRAWFGKFSSVVQQFGMSRGEVDHSVFYRHSSVGFIYLIVYVDDIVLIGSDNLGISLLKQHLCRHFKTKRHHMPFV